MKTYLKPSLFLVALGALLVPTLGFCEELELPEIALKIGDTNIATGGTIASTLKIVAIFTVIAFLPSICLTMTSFTRIAVVLGMTRQALGTQQLPPSTILTGLALFLTFAVMNPVFSDMYTGGIKPYMDGIMGYEEAMKKASKPMKEFLVGHSREKDIALFLDITGSEMPEDVENVSFVVAVPAFVLSELFTAFQIGFLIALPFLVLDMVVSSVLTSMSMITLPPTVISLPLKLMLFVIVDGWHLIISSVVQTYHV
ncbi:MAG: flagellar type III secretion system pore protein FliP [Bdellovibrionota bacterium]|jgi:flagellar biosynthetic protein FliP